MERTNHDMRAIMNPTKVTIEATRSTPAAGELLSKGRRRRTDRTPGQATAQGSLRLWHGRIAVSTIPELSSEPFRAERAMPYRDFIFFAV